MSDNEEIKQMTWPFPPPTGPKPWTPKEVKDYEKLKRQQLPEAPI